MAWDYEEVKDRPPTTQIANIAKIRLGKDAGDAVNAMMDAYRVLSTKAFKNADELRDYFCDNGKQILTPEQAESIFEKTQKGMKGGATESVVNDTLTSVLNIISGKTSPGPPSPAIKAAIASIQQAIRIVLPFVFILNTLEQSPLFGELLGAALDITVSVLPVTASTVQSGTPALVGLIPLPFAGPVGIALGWLFSFFFLWLAMVISVSRQDFATALEATAGMIPIFGGTAMKSVATFDRVTTKLANRAERIQQSIEQVYGSLKGAVEQITSKPGFQNAVSVINNAPIATIAKNTDVYKNVMNSPTIQTAKLVANTPGMRAAKSIATSPATRGLLSVGSNIASSPSYQRFRRATGGKRLTRRKKYTNKWRRTRHRSRRR